MIQYLLFGTSKLLNISEITKRIGNFFKLPIQLFYSISYPELALYDNAHIRGINIRNDSRPPQKVWDLCLGDSTMRKIYDRFLQFSHLNVKFALKC